MRERRQSAGLALAEESSAKRVVVVPGERPVKRVIGKVRLHDHLAGQLRATRTARHLHQQRGQALGGAEIGAVEGIVRAEHPDQREAREVVSLGKHLRADQDVELVARHARAHVRERVPPPRGVAVHARNPRAGERGREALLEPLRAVAERQQVDVAARRTGARHALAMPAVVADERGRGAMAGEPRAAARASCLPAAGRALERRREAAPVHEHERLLATLEAGGDRRHEGRSEAVVAAGVTRRDEPDRRRCGARIGTMLEEEARIAPGARVRVALERRRGAAEHDRNAEPVRAPHGGVARVIADAIVLLVRAVVLLVDDDEREPRQRARTRRAGCRGRGRPRRVPPAPSSSAARRRAMRCAASPCARCGSAAATRATSCGVRLISGTSSNACPPAATTDADRGQIDLGLAAARHALQQERREAPARGIDRRHRLRLGLVEPQLARGLRTRCAGGHQPLAAPAREHATQMRGERGDRFRLEHGAFGKQLLEQRARGGRPGERGRQRDATRVRQRERTRGIPGARRRACLPAASPAQRPGREAPGSRRPRTARARARRRAAAATSTSSLDRHQLLRGLPATPRRAPLPRRRPGVWRAARARPRRREARGPPAPSSRRAAPPRPAARRGQSSRPPSARSGRAAAHGHRIGRG